MSAPDAVDRAVEEVVTTSYDRLVAYLASLGNDLAAAEDALGDALAAAVVSWRRDGVPVRPVSWLLTAARRNLIGAARRRDTARRAEPSLLVLADELGEAEQPGPVPDHRLALLYVCAHPAIDARVRAPLMLQTVLRLDAARIASAFVVSPSTMGQRLSRAKTKIRDARIPFEVPDGDQLPHRTRAVLDTIYAAYGAGWDDPGGLDARRSGLTEEAERLARLVVELQPADAEARGLLALILHQQARSAARRDAEGRFVPLDQQDVSRWSRSMMLEGEQQLTAAFELRAIGPYQLHAAIHSVHNRRALTGQTDWQSIAALYDGLVAHAPGLGAHVARAAAHGWLHGPAQGLVLLDQLPVDRVTDYQPYWATRAHLLGELGDSEAARVAADRAAALSSDPAVRDHLRRASQGPDR